MKRPAELPTNDLPRRPRPRRRVVRFVLIACGVLLIPWIVFCLLTQPEAFIVRGVTMEPTLHHGDRLIVTKYPKAYQRGDIVIVRSPRVASGSGLLLKRIVAVGGDTIECRQGQLVINGQAIERERGDVSESRTLWSEVLDGRKYWTALRSWPGGRTRSFEPIDVPQESVFLLGDNRDKSQDSRIWGPLPIDRVVGKVLFVWWSAR